MADDRKQRLKELFIYFRKTKIIEKTSDHDFLELTALLDLNAQLANPKKLNTTIWALVNPQQAEEHQSMHGHICLANERICSAAAFLETAIEYGRCEKDITGQFSRI